jgi:hypothetical protein
MYKKLFSLHLILLCLCFWLSPCSAATFPPGPKPINIKVGLRVDDIIRISERDQVLTFEGQVRMSWKDPRLAFSESEAGSAVKMFVNQAAVAELDKIWRPEIIFPDSRGAVVVGARFLRVLSDGRVIYRKRIHATIGVSLDLRDFPLDKQKIVFRLASFPYSADLVAVSVDNGFGESEYAHLTDQWVIASHYTKIKDNSIYEMVFHLVRKPQFYIYQVFIPLVLIVLLSLTVFWMTDQPLVNRSALILACVLAAMVFQWRVFSVTPQVSYQLLVDQLILWSLLVIGSALIASLIAHQFKKERSLRIMRGCRIGYPVVYISVFLLIIMLHYLV